MRPRRIAILTGGRSSEHAVSLASARAVAAALRGLGMEVATIEIARSGRWALASTNPAGLSAAPRGAERGGDLQATSLPAGAVASALADVDVVFPLLHGPFGEDGTVQGLLELAGVPYVGAGVTASGIAMDKDLFKALMGARGVPVARHVVLRPGDPARQPFTYPVFVKPARLGSSIGISKAHSRSELAAALELAFRHDEKVLVEEFVEGVEIEVGVLGNREPIASLPGEIAVARNEWYDYEAKYVEGEMDLIVPARIGTAEQQRARELAIEAYLAIECEGMARVDLFVRADGQVVVNELNTIPGFTETSVYAKLFAASGLDYTALLERLVELALERHERRSTLVF